MREWQEYEAAVKDKDLARALRFLRDVQVVEVEDDKLTESTRFKSELGVYGWERDWEVLDTCLNADDMRLVGAAYAFLKDKGFLPTFGKYRNIGKILINLSYYTFHTSINLSILIVCICVLVSQCMLIYGVVSN